MREERKLTERKLTLWLADYRDSLDSLVPPAALETRLRAEVRRRRREAVAPWLLAASAAALLVLGIWIGRSRPEEKLARAVPTLRVPHFAAPQLAALPPTTASRLPALSPPETGLKPRRSLNSVARSVKPPSGGAAESAIFVLLPGSELLPPAQDLQVLRMRIPRSRFQALGWPVNPDRVDERVLADVVVGGDGVARAVRLVATDQ